MQKKPPPIEEKISLKILLQPTAVSQPHPIQVPPIAPKLPAPMPKPIQPQIIIPPKTPLIPMIKPTKPTQVSPAPVIATPPLVSKAPETAPVSLVKAPPAPPPPPKVQENYEEENLGKIRSILVDRLKYPKNALRLKQQGEAIVTFTLGTDRSVSQVTLTKSSEFELLDDAARNLIESSASEFPKPSKSVRISVPIVYKLR